VRRSCACSLRNALGEDPWNVGETEASLRCKKGTQQTHQKVRKGSVSRCRPIFPIQPSFATLEKLTLAQGIFGPYAHDTGKPGPEKSRELGLTPYHRERNRWLASGKRCLLWKILPLVATMLTLDYCPQYRYKLKVAKDRRPGS
jgi:hypothetical protein